MLPYRFLYTTSSAAWLKILKNADFEKGFRPKPIKRLRETDQSYIDLFFEAFDATGAKLSAPDILQQDS